MPTLADFVLLERTAAGIHLANDVASQIRDTFVLPNTGTSLGVMSNTSTQTGRYARRHPTIGQHEPPLVAHVPHIEPLKEKPPDGAFSSGNSSTRAPHPPVPPPVHIRPGAGRSGRTSIVC
jgi:hypothetical protein